jgi:hypothetical protein
VGIDGATVFHFRSPRDDDRRFTHYQAFAIDARPAEKKSPKQSAKRSPKRAPRKSPKTPLKEHRWTQKLPILARAMLMAGDDLFLAGPPDLFATSDPRGALEGTQGGRLMVLAAADGTQKAQRQLESPPVFDGLAVAAGHLYMATTDGKIVCFDAAR